METMVQKLWIPGVQRTLGTLNRFVRTFKKAMKAEKHDGQTSQHQLENFLFTYCTVPHATAGVTPCLLFL